MTSEVTVQPFEPIGDLEPGDCVAGYVLEEQISEGRMAVVFRARDHKRDRIAAVKVIMPPEAADPEFRARFLRESRAVAAIKSEHIIPVYEAGEAEGMLYIAMQWAAGGDLAALTRRAGGSLAPQRAAALVSQVASALDAAHATGFVHRDVNPQNILIDSTPELPEHAFLADFGLAKGIGPFTGLASAAQFIDVSEYCSPEQIEAASVDGRADQYALGCVAFALLTGQTPFDRDDTVATLHAQVHDPVPSLCQIRPDLPPAVDRVIARALAKSPADRYERCGEFAASLQAAMAQSGPATAVSLPASPPVADPPEIARPVPELPAPPHRSAVPAPTAGSGAATLAPDVGYATSTGESGRAGGMRPPLTWEPLPQPRRQRLSGRTAVIAAAVAVALAAVAVIYAVRPGAATHSVSPVAAPSAALAQPTAQSPGSTRPAGQPHGTTAASAGPATGPSGSTASAAQQGSPGTPPGKQGKPGTPGGQGTAPAGLVPGQVTGLAATPGDGRIALTWQAATGSPTGYQVEVSPAPAGQNAVQRLGVTTSDTVTSLTAGTTYRFTVLASNAVGNGPWSAGVAASPFGQPRTMPGPTAVALAATATGAGSHTSATITTIRVTVNLGTSTDNGSPITSFTWYEYKASSSSGPWTLVRSQSASSHSSSMVLGPGAALFDETNDGSWYEFTATATNAAGESPQSPRSSPAIQVVAPAASSPAAAAS